MATDPTTRIAGGEGDLTVSGIQWCKVSASVSETRNQVDVQSACDWDDDDQVVWGVSKTVGKRLQIQASFHLDTAKDPWPTFGGSANTNDTLEVTLVLRTGFTVSGTFTCSELSLESGGTEGVWEVSVTLMSQSKPDIRGAA